MKHHHYTLRLSRKWSLFLLIGCVLSYPAIQDILIPPANAMNCDFLGPEQCATIKCHRNCREMYGERIVNWCDNQHYNQCMGGCQSLKREPGLITDCYVPAPQDPPSELIPYPPGSPSPTGGSGGGGGGGTSSGGGIETPNPGDKKKICNIRDKLPRILRLMRCDTTKALILYIRPEPYIPPVAPANATFY